MDALLASVDHKHSEAVAEAGGQHHKLGHPKTIVHLGNTNSGKSGSFGSTGGGPKFDESSTHGPAGAGPKTVDQDSIKKNPIPATERTPPSHGGPRPKPTPGHGLPVIGGPHHGHYPEGNNNAAGHIVAGHHPEGMMRCTRCSCIFTECQCGKSRQVGMPYCPNPNTADVPKEFKTIVQIYRKIPEMKTVEKITQKKKVSKEERKFYFEREVIYYEDVERVELIPVIKEVPRTIKEFVYEIITTEVEVPYTELEVDYREDIINDEKPIFKTKEVPETISVPVVVDKEVTRMCEEPTGQWCEVPVEDFCTRGDFNLICDDEAHDHSSSSDSSDSDSSHAHRHRHHTHTNGGRYNDSPKSATKSKNLKNRSETEKTSGVKPAVWWP